MGLRFLWDMKMKSLWLLLFPSLSLCLSLCLSPVLPGFSCIFLPLDEYFRWSIFCVAKFFLPFLFDGRTGAQMANGEWNNEKRQLKQKQQLQLQNLHKKVCHAARGGWGKGRLGNPRLRWKTRHMHMFVYIKKEENVTNAKPLSLARGSTLPSGLYIFHICMIMSGLA